MTQKKHSDITETQSCKTGVMPRLYVMMFSGGRTSAVLAKHLKENPDKYPNVIYVFLNTGKEVEKTLQFVNKCDKEWNLGVIYLEALINNEKGKGTTYKIVDFETASRNGEPFEAMLKKYPLPTNFASNCTRELKQRPIDAYLRDNFKDYELIKVIGIRADEAHRKSIHAEKEKIIYPLCDEIPFNSKMIRMFWDNQSFDLGLKDYEGNCDLCFKKSLKKRLTIIKENPESAKWWLEMENKYAEYYTEIEYDTEYIEVEVDGQMITESVKTNERYVDKRRYFDSRSNIGIE
jgi:3'-phosphoadenosine 5'-phosphosulfate sulfotransferase (PAPS reductase)/FAD synthetase